MRGTLLIAASACCFVAAPASAKDAVYMSLMGEPYWTNSVGEHPFDQWLKMADRNLDRRVTVDEFRKTAQRRFANYDVDKDGRLTRKELR